MCFLNSQDSTGRASWPSWDPIVVLVQLSPGPVLLWGWHRGRWLCMFLSLSYLQATLLTSPPFKFFLQPHNHPEAQRGDVLYSKSPSS